jgi:hypothetical protein
VTKFGELINEADVGVAPLNPSLGRRSALELPRDTIDRRLGCSDALESKSFGTTVMFADGWMRELLV